MNSAPTASRSDSSGRLTRAQRFDLLGTVVRGRWRFVIDVLAWVVSITLGMLVRFDFQVPDRYLSQSLAVLPVVVAAQLTVGWARGLYSGRWHVGSIDEVRSIAETVVVTASVVVVAALVMRERPVPLSVLLAAGPMALIFQGTTRFYLRTSSERTNRPSVASATHRLLVFGAGHAGAELVSALVRDANSDYVPVALADDDASKGRLRIRGVAVMGTRSDISHIASRTGADTMVIAVPSANSQTVSELSDIGRGCGLEVRVLPSISEIVRGTATAVEMRPLSDVDLLGRREVRTDLEAVAGLISGRRVLVTGAGGSIGSELCRQLKGYGPDRLVMLDRDESALHRVELSVSGRALLSDPAIELADIRDERALRDVFSRHHPEVVFHAAAMKHLTILERFPDQAVQTNVIGTLNLLKAAHEADVAILVNISTDKAARPVSVLGATKRIAERLTSHFGGLSPSNRWMSVRFGNVLGSRGSVLETFHHQISAGGPVTVTDPAVTRYFMTVGEAVQLILQAAALGRSGEALVLDMGEPVAISEVARRLIANASASISIVYTGLRPGEKLHEELFAETEERVPSRHPLISHVSVPPLEPASDEFQSLARSGRVTINQLRTLS